MGACHKTEWSAHSTMHTVQHSRAGGWNTTRHWVCEVCMVPLCCVGLLWVPRLLLQSEDKLLYESVSLNRPYCWIVYVRMKVYAQCDPHVRGTTAVHDRRRAHYNLNQD